MVSNYLESISEAHRKIAREDGRNVDELIERALKSRSPLGFKDTLLGARKTGLRLIAEIKRASPSKGLIAPDLVPEAMAGLYARGGAACISVLTDSEFFQGSTNDLERVRASVGLPILRKDFTVCVADVCDARIMGADAVLMIVTILSRTELETLLGTASSLGIDALVEVHNAKELDIALACGAELIGVNQRNLETFAIDHQVGEQLIGKIPEHVAAVGESGIANGQDAERLAKVGYDAILVGEAIVTAVDPVVAVRDLQGYEIGVRG